MPKIPFLDLVTLHAELKDELLSVFARALGTAGFIGTLCRKDQQPGRRYPGYSGARAASRSSCTVILNRGFWM
jgi:hypothetical protein